MHFPARLTNAARASTQTCKAAQGQWSVGIGGVLPASPMLLGHANAGQDVTQVAVDSITHGEDIEKMQAFLPWMTVDAQWARRRALGLDTPSTLAFMEGCEFISLGCFCAVSCSLQTLGLKKYSYPLDWVRSDMRGVIHCLETSFEDFLTFRSVNTEDTPSGICTVFRGSRWGGSFWHHDIQDPGIQNDMTRRAERLLGVGEVPPSTSRVFIFAVNSTRDLDDALHLKNALRRMLPETPFKILFLIDRQKQSGAMRLEGIEGSDMIFYQIAFEKHRMGVGPEILFYAEPYAVALAFAIKCWTSIDTLATVRTLPSLVDISATCDHWYGGDPASVLFQPEHFQGRRMMVRNACSRLPKLVAERVGQFELPANFVGGKVQTNAFGNPVMLNLPQEACAGMKVEMRLVEGVVTALLLATGTTAMVSVTVQSMVTRQGAAALPPSRQTISGQ